MSRSRRLNRDGSDNSFDSDGIAPRRTHSRTFSTKSGQYQGRLEYAMNYMDGHPVDDEPQACDELAVASSSVIKFYPEWCECFECINVKNHPSLLQVQGGCADHIRQAFLCPPSGPWARVLEFSFLVVSLWLFFWLLLLHVDPEHKSRSPAAWGGPITAIFFLEIIGLFLGIFMKCVGLPSLLGPLLLGIMIRNLEPINIFHNFEGWETRQCYEIKNDTRRHDNCNNMATMFSSHWIKPIRQIALTLILTRAGLELSPKQLRKLKGVVPMLAFIPCLTEAATCAAIIYLFFNVLITNDMEKISIPMCFVAGFALAAVSPAVVVPGMLSMKKKGYGVDQGVDTLLIAASSIDDVLAISAYTIFLGLAVPSGHSGEEWKTFAGGPIGLAVGILHGIVVGSFLHFIPAKHSSGLAVNRLILLLLFNFVALFVYELEELVEGAGSLAVLVTSFIASFGWRGQRHWKKPMKKIEHLLAHMWTLFVPLLFGTIGREVDFQDPGFSPSIVGKIIGTILISLIIRCTVTFFIAGMAKLNLKERLFCSLSWIPKATVQAALAPLVLTKIRSQHHGIQSQTAELESEILLKHGKIVVTTAVLAILLTAPLGSVLIALCGPKLLRKTSEHINAELDKEFPDGDGEPIVCDDFKSLNERARAHHRNDEVEVLMEVTTLPTIESATKVDLGPPEPPVIASGSKISVVKTSSKDKSLFSRLLGY